MWILGSTYSHVGRSDVFVPHKAETGVVCADYHKRFDSGAWYLVPKLPLEDLQALFQSNQALFQSNLDPKVTRKLLTAMQVI